MAKYKRKSARKKKEELGWVVPAAAAAGALATAAANAYKANRDSKKGRNTYDANIEQIDAKTRIDSKKIESENLHYTQKVKLNKWYILFGSLVVVYGIKKASELIKQWKKEKEATKKFSDEINDKDLILKETDFQNMAKKLQLSLDAFNVDENAIYREIDKLHNASEWKMLVKTFGLYKSTSALMRTFEGNLVEWFYHQLDNSEIRKLNDKLQKIFVNI